MKISWSQIGTVFLLFPGVSTGEILTDGSLGQATSIKGPNYNIDASLGQVSGTNLFHSFSTFNLNTSESASFSGPVSVQNIFSRVTGDSASNIDGALGSSIKGANLHFINPNGIIFGKNASLNLSGSFYASTADYIELQDGVRFDVVKTTGVKLSSSSIASYGFLDSNIGEIQLNQANLQVSDGKNLSLIGGNINIQGSGKQDAKGFTNLGNTELAAPNGQLEIISLASAGEVSIQNNQQRLKGVSAQGDVTITNAAELTVRGNPGGKVVIRAGKLVIEDAIIDASNTGDLKSTDSAIDIKLSGDLLLQDGELAQGSVIQASSLSSGQSGDIDISSKALIMKGEGVVSRINTSAVSSGTSGDININTGLLEQTTAKIDTENTLNGQSGNINISAQRIRQNAADRGASINSFNLGQGLSGDIFITGDTYTATGSDAFGFVGISSTAAENSLPSNIKLEVNNIKLLDGAQINVTKKEFIEPPLQIFSIVNASSAKTAPLDIITIPDRRGDIDINTDTLLISGRSSGINPTSQLSNQGEVRITGNITINANQLIVDRLGEINSRVNFTSTSDSGDINIQTIALDIKNSAIISSSALDFGQSGGINIDANTINIESGALISSTAENTGFSGEININTDTLNIAGSDRFNEAKPTQQSGIYSNIQQSSRGAKDINIVASDSVTLRNGAAISSETEGVGNGGNVHISSSLIDISGFNQATKSFTRISSSAIPTKKSPTGGQGGDIHLIADTIKIGNQAKINADTLVGASGDAGNINLSASNILLNSGAVISAKSSSTGDAGDISLIADKTLKIDQSSVETDTLNSTGGNITLNAIKMMSIESSDITTSVGGGEGNGGNISIDPELLYINKSNIVANAVSGSGGHINIQAENMLISPDSLISSSSSLGVDGQLIINIDNENVNKQVERISAVIPDGKLEFKQTCAAANGSYSSFVIQTSADSVFEQTGLISIPLQSTQSYAGTKEESQCSGKNI